MRFRTVSLLVLAAAAVPSPAGDEPQTVKAMRYAIVWADSALDLSHGGGRWVQELYFPETKVACTLVHEWAGSGDVAKPVRTPRLHATFEEGPRNHRTGLGDAGPSPIEEVRVPAALAEEILALAELTRRRVGHCNRGRGVAGARGGRSDLTVPGQ